VIPHCTSNQNTRSVQGTLPLQFWQVARLLSESFLMLGRMVSNSIFARNNNSGGIRAVSVVDVSEFLNPKIF